MGCLAVRLAAKLHLIEITSFVDAQQVSSSLAMSNVGNQVGRVPVSVCVCCRPVVVDLDQAKLAGVIENPDL